MDRDSITDRLAVASADLMQAELAAQAAGALEYVTRLPGLWYAPLDAEHTRYVVALNGKPLGEMWPAAPGRVLLEWSAQPIASQPMGPFPTARAAAAALARHYRAAGIEPPADE